MGIVRFELVTVWSSRFWYHVKELSQLKSLIKLLDEVSWYDLYYSLKLTFIFNRCCCLSYLLSFFFFFYSSTCESVENLLIRDDGDIFRLGSLVLFVKCLIMAPNPSNLTCTLSDPCSRLIYVTFLLRRSWWRGRISGGDFWVFDFERRCWRVCLWWHKGYLFLRNNRISSHEGVCIFS
jgi:hypothetical protein